VKLTVDDDKKRK